MPETFLPKVVRVRQSLPVIEIENIGQTVLAELKNIGFEDLDLTGKQIGITAGSRGITGMVDILKAISDSIRVCKGQPIIIPSMGSHGGGTEEGQIDVLDGLGITEGTIGAAIRPCTESIEIGKTDDGVPVFCNKLALEMDGIIVVNRIKKHTDFTGEIESGLHKMLTIGLGGPKGAHISHTHAMVIGYEKVMTSVASVLCSKLPLICGVGIVENWKGGLAKIEAIAPEALYEREASLLALDKKTSIRLPFDQLNVLIVGELGKNISGAGMDGNIVGRTRLIRQADPKTPDIDRIIVLSLTPETHGNALGIGLADLTTQRVAQGVDVHKTALNCVTSMAPEHAAIPCTMINDLEAILAGIRTAGLTRDQDVRLAYIQNTKKLEYIAVSENLIGEVRSNPQLEILGTPETMTFDSQGNLTNFRYSVEPQEAH